MDPKPPGDEHLDIEYLNTLRNIKPYITCIMNKHYIELVRVWLEKLSDTRLENKPLRNEYLVELGKQIISGVFNEPFIDPPNQGALKPFKPCWKNRKNEATNTQSNNNNNNNTTDKIIVAKKTPQERLEEVREDISKVLEYTKEIKVRPLRKKRSKTKRLQVQSDGVYRDLYIPLRKQEKMLKRPPEDDAGSWMDLSDNASATATMFGSGDGTPRVYDVEEARHLQEAYERKIASLMEMIEHLKEENTMLNHHVDKYRELIDIKTSLQNTRFAASSEWQNAVKALQKKLNVVQKRHDDLRLENDDLRRRVERSDAERKAELAAQKQRAAELHRRETEMLKGVHAAAVAELEAKSGRARADLEAEGRRRAAELRDAHDARMTAVKEEFEGRAARVTAEYEAKLRAFKAEFEERLAGKNAEIDKLEQLLQEQCIRMHDEVQIIRNQIESNLSNDNEVYVRKIAFLQKCVLKMEKLYRKSEKENAKQLLKLRKELEYKSKSNQLALTTQKAEMLANSLDGKQGDYESIFSDLESHYKSLIKEQQRKMMEEKRRDTKIIEDLKAELSKYKPDYLHL